METAALLAIFLAATAMAGTAEAELWVSAGDAPGGIIAGAQVVQVIVDNGAEANEPAGEPRVDVGSMTLRMVQGSDARWYAHFADSGAAMAADRTVMVDGQGLDFGTLCESDADANELLARITGADQDYFGDTDGVAFPLAGECGESYGDGARAMSVLRRERDANTAIGIGQSIHVEGDARATATGVWPFIQLYDLGSSVTVRHDSDSVELEYGTTQDVAAVALDRELYPPGADVHIEVADSWLNIDPTDRDSWTWDVGGEGAGLTVYRAFDMRGEATGNVADVSGSFGALGCDDTCELIVDLGDGALETVTNRNGQNTLGTRGGNDGIVTLVETGANTGIFASYDAANSSSIKVARDAPRGTSMAVSYASARSIVIGHGDASLDLAGGGAWASGTRADVTLSDADANKNSRQQESLDVSDAGATIPTIITGSPLTLRDAASVHTFDARGERLETAHETDSYGARALITPSAAASGLVIDYGAARAPVHAEDTVTNLLNYDVRSTGARAIDIIVWAGTSSDGRPLVLGTELEARGLVEPSSDRIFPFKARIGTGLEARGLVELPRAAVAAMIATPYTIIEIALDTPAPSGRTMAIVADIVSFGVAGSERVANQVVRLELEETGVDTATFAGTLEYTLPNQLSIADASTYADLATIGDQASMVAVDGGEDITMTYADRAADGSERIVSGVAVTASHTGSVSFDRDEYGASDTITVTLRDADLNTNPDTIESYRVGSVGGGLIVLTLNGIQWTDRPGCPAPGPDLTLSETGEATGVFVGQLRLPREWCDGESTSPISTARAKIGITYADYTDDHGVAEVAEGEARRVGVRTMPLAISGIEVLKSTQEETRVAVDLTGRIGAAFDLIVQATGAGGVVQSIVSTERAIGGSGALRAIVSWEQDGEAHVIEAFAWTDGIALAEPAILHRVIIQPTGTCPPDCGGQPYW